MRELIDMEEAEPFCILSSSAVKELMRTSVSMNRTSLTVSELMRAVLMDANCEAVVPAFKELTAKELTEPLAN